MSYCNGDTFTFIKVVAGIRLGHFSTVLRDS